MHTKFRVNQTYNDWIMLRTKFKYKKYQRAITQKIRGADKLFLCTALLIIDINMHTKFRVNPTYNDWFMHPTKIEYNN